MTAVKITATVYLLLGPVWINISTMYMTTKIIWQNTCVNESRCFKNECLYGWQVWVLYHEINSYVCMLTTGFVCLFVWWPRNLVCLWVCLLDCALTMCFVCLLGRLFLVLFVLGLCVCLLGFIWHKAINCHAQVQVSLRCIFRTNDTGHHSIQRDP